jgi:limonene-1,2-epoxide hydrolase
VRPVRLGASALDDIEAQVPTDRLDGFRQHDLRPLLEALSKDEAIWDEVGVPHGPGRRITLVGQTVAGFHLFIIEDLADPRPGALVVFAAYVWLDDFPG